MERGRVGINALRPVTYFEILVQNLSAPLVRFLTASALAFPHSFSFSLRMLRGAIVRVRGQTSPLCRFISFRPTPPVQRSIFIFTNSHSCPFFSQFLSFSPSSSLSISISISLSVSFSISSFTSHVPPSHILDTFSSFSSPSPPKRGDKFRTSPSRRQWPVWSSQC